MKRTFSLLCLLICLNAHSQISQRCPVCPPSLNGVTDGWCLVDSAGKAVWQPCGASTLTASQGLNKVGSDVRLGGGLNRGNALIECGTNVLMITNDSTFPSNNISAVVFNDGAAMAAGTSSDSMGTNILFSNTSNEMSVQSTSTGMVAAFYQDSTGTTLRTEYNGLNFQFQALDNQGTKTNFCAERNVFSEDLGRDIQFDGMHYGDIERFISDTLSEFPRYYDLTKIDSVVRVIHGTSADNSNYALRINEDTAQTLLFDSGEAYIKTYYHNGVVNIASNKPIAIGLNGRKSQALVTATTITVTFGGTQPDANYQVMVTPTNALSAALFYVTNKTTTTFDVEYLAGITGTVTFDWQVVR